MATFNTVGFEVVERLFLHQSEIATRAVPQMLRAGANVLIEGQKAESEAMGIRRTGDFIGSIGIYKEELGDASSTIIVAPKGKDRKGIRNVEKGFIVEYGLKTGRASSRRRGYRIGNRNQTARPWMATANEKNEERVHQAMRAVWEGMNNGI